MALFSAILCHRIYLLGRFESALNLARRSILFESIEEIREKLAAQEYVCDRRLATVVYLAVKLDKPVLIEGPAGVGKTELAKSLAAAADRSLIRLQCYEGLDEAKALYEWEYGKQLLYTQVLREKIGTVEAEHPPVVILTSNRTRELSEALKRRCLHLQIDYPNPEVELEIVRLKAPGVGDALARELVETIQEIRTLDLRKSPSIGETLDWARSLVVLGAPNLDKDLIEETLSVIIKYDRDAEKVLAHVGSGPGRKDLGQKEPTGENPNEAMYEMHRSTHKHTH